MNHDDTQNHVNHNVPKNADCSNITTEKHIHDKQIHAENKHDNNNDRQQMRIIRIIMRVIMLVY